MVRRGKARRHAAGEGGERDERQARTSLQQLLIDGTVLADERRGLHLVLRQHT